MPEDSAGQAEAAGLRSRVVRAGTPGTWDGIRSEPYRRADGRPADARRALLAGGPASGCAFELRYFELAPGGRTCRERHRHQHAVVVLAGEGEVMLGDAVHLLHAGDLVRVAPGELHQFRNPTANPFGFLCVVDAARDRPVAIGEDDAASCSVDPAPGSR
jgi:quercetin dioxygenase-like cupin family protein